MNKRPQPSQEINNMLRDNLIRVTSQPQFNPAAALRTVQDVRNSESGRGINPRVLGLTVHTLSLIASSQKTTPVQDKWTEYLVLWAGALYQKYDIKMSYTQRNDITSTVHALKEKGPSSLINKADCDALIASLPTYSMAAAKKQVSAVVTHSSRS